MPSGFLVVLEPKLGRVTGKLYAGVGRVPTYPSKVPGEERGMDEYVFGGVKDEGTNLIPSLQAAVRLCEMLGRGGRGFEIIYCRDGEEPIPGPGLEIGSAESLGYDITGISGDCWSIVDDFAQSQWAKPFCLRLNPSGLFVGRTDAEAYLREYIRHNEYYADAAFKVIEVIRITQSR